MKEDTFHILESFGMPECRERLPMALALLEKLEKNLDDAERLQTLDKLLGIFEAQQETAHRVSGFQIELDIKELIGVLTHNRRLLINRLRVFKNRSD